MADREAATTSTPKPRVDAAEPQSKAQSKFVSKSESASESKPKPRLEQAPGEIGGPPGPEPTRYGDWERNGICTDF